MISSIKRHYPLLILLVLALCSRFLFLSYPSEVVFDEVHFGKFVSAYFTRQYYFDIHPPLGKLMIAGFARLNDIRPDVSFEKIGQAVSSHELFVLRFLPALFGSLLVLLVYQIVRALGGSERAAFLGAGLVLFDNAFLVESKFILVDSFLFFFGFSSILVFLLSQKQEGRIKKHLLYFSSVVLAALALSIKWTGLAFLGIIFLFSFINLLKKIELRRILKFFAEVVVSLLLAAVIYTIPFVIHFDVLSRSGPGDAFMSSEFQKNLEGSPLGKQLKPMSFQNKFMELNQAMFFYNSTLSKEHPDGSSWYQWPLMKKPVWYWNKNADSQQANIYLSGNPAVWYASFVAVLAGAWVLFKKNKWATFFLISGYLVNLLPFILVSRVAFLYHYLPALIFSILILALWSDRFSKKTLAAYSLLVVFGFLAMAPLSYGFFLSDPVARLYQALMALLHL